MSGNNNETEIGAQSGEASRSRAGRLPDDADCQLNRFVRNRYFQGKLMTARDMKREQEYHADRLETLTQHVTGKGAVCGLSTRLEQESEDEPLEITVEPGYALDYCGRPVLLDTTADKSVPADDLPEVGDAGPQMSDGTELPPGLSVYVRLIECHTEKVPVKGSEDACREDCTYNRVVEDFEVVYDQEPPEIKPIRDIDFPERANLENHEETGVGKHDPALHTIVRSYYEDDSRDDHYRLCEEEGDPKVFLGYYAREDSTGWVREEAAPRHHAYTNDMLYAAIARHTADFRNPHEVLVGVDEYIRDKVVKYTIEAFYEVADRYANIDSEYAQEVNASAREIILRARDALDRNYFRNEPAFIITALYIASLEKDLHESLRDSRDDGQIVSDRSFEDYDAMFDRLRNLLTPEVFEEFIIGEESADLWGQLLDGTSPEELIEEIDSDIDATELAVVLDQIAETAGWLDLEEESQMVLPGASEETDARIIKTAIDRRSEGAEEISELRARLEQLENQIQEPQAPRFERPTTTVRETGVANIDVTFGEADSLGFRLGSENVRYVFEVGLTAGEDETVALNFDTGAVENEEDSLTVDGDAELHFPSEQPLPRDEELDPATYPMQLLVPDLDGWVIDRASLLIQERG